MRSLGTDVRGAWRSLRADCWFALATVVTLALGIGAAGGLAGGARAAFFPRLPFAHPSSLVEIYEEAPRAGIKDFHLPFLNYLIVRQVRRVFSGVALYIPPEATLPLNLSAGTARGPLPGAVVSANFFRVLGVAPRLGPGFAPQADPMRALPGAGVVISHGLWARDFGSSPSVIGQALRINGRLYNVAGVMPAGFAFPSGSELWIAAADPAAVSAVANSRSAFSEHIPHTVARLQPGLTPARGPLALLLAGALAVLLAAWLVAAVLGWVRAVRHSREMAVYAALGGRAAPLRRLLWEQILLAALGALAALAVAAWMARAAAAVLPASALGSSRPALGVAALASVVLLAALSVLLPGLVTAGRLRHLDIARALQAGGGSLTAGRGQRRALGLWVAVLAGAGFVLATAAGTALWAFRRAADAPLGWQPASLWFVPFVIHGSRNGRPLSPELARLAHSAAALPGVRAAAVAGSPPLGETGSLSIVAAPGARVRISPTVGTSLAELAVGTQYFRTMGIAVLAGRAFRPGDFAPGAAPVVIVDRAVARQYWGSVGNALGRVLRTANGSFQNTRVIGVVATTRTNYGYFQPNYPTAYVPAPGALVPSIFSLVLRMYGRAPPTAAAIRGAFQQVSPNWAAAPPVAASNLLAQQARPYRAQSAILLLFALLALALLFLGSLSVVSYVAEARTRELSIRLALGASPGQISALIARQTAWPVLVGLVAGLVGALLWLAPLAHLLGYGVRGLPAGALLSAAAAMTAGALPATLRQHLRLRALNPARALRQE